MFRSRSRRPPINAARRGMPFGSKERADNISATRDFIGMYRRELERKAQGLKPSWCATRALRHRQQQLNDAVDIRVGAVRIVLRSIAVLKTLGTGNGFGQGRLC